MQVSNNQVPVKDAIAVEVIKKSQEVVENQISDILKRNFDPQEIAKEVAKSTGAGGKLNIEA